MLIIFLSERGEAGFASDCVSVNHKIVVNIKYSILLEVSMKHHVTILVGWQKSSHPSFTVFPSFIYIRDKLV